MVGFIFVPMGRQLPVKWQVFGVFSLKFLKEISVKHFSATIILTHSLGIPCSGIHVNFLLNHNQATAPHHLFFRGLICYIKEGFVNVVRLESHGKWLQLWKISKTLLWGEFIEQKCYSKNKIDPCSKEKKKKTTQIYCDGIQKIMLKYVKFTGLHPGP